KIDNVAPSTPTLTDPADSLLTNALPQLHATFADGTAGGDSGTVEFQLCSSPAPAGASCAPVVQSVTSGLVSNGGTASATPGALAKWSPSSLPVDGLYYWQARSHDSAGNVSAWTAIRTLHLDTVAPGKPLTFTGVVAADGLTLRWSAPNDDVANYVVFVNGAPWKNLGS